MKASITPISRTFWSKSGLAAARPAATGLRNGSLWYSTDTKDIDQIQAGAWVTILDFSALAGSVLTTRGDILTRSASADKRLAKGTAGHVLTMGADEPAWGALYMPAGKLTVLHFQIQPATGTFSSSVANLNNNNYTNYCGGNTINQYAEVYFYALMRMTQFRIYGKSGLTEDGRWKLQYLNSAGVWTDWKTGIPCRATETFSAWDSSGGEVIGNAIRLVVTTVDSSSISSLKELEVKY